MTQLQADLKTLGELKVEKPLIDKLAKSGRTLEIKADMSTMNDEWDFSVQVDVADQSIVQTTAGPQAVPSIIKLSHELPHAILGTKGDGPGNMNNVNAWENPVRRALGYPSRTQY